LWILFIAGIFIAISAENGLRGGMVFLGVMSIIAMVVAFEAWLFLNADPLMVCLVFIFIGMWPFGILFGAAFVQITFMVFAGAVGAAIGLVLGSMYKESVPRLPDPSGRRERPKQRRHRRDF